jgi:tRNA(Glu) U13 pseudouridine synthase TruD
MNIDGASKSSSCSCCSCCGVSPNGVDADSSRLRECDVQISHRRAIETIPYGARLIWVHAYQSWLWNKVASRRLFISDSIQQAGEPRLGDLLDLQLLDPAQRSALSSHQIVDIGSDSTRNVIEIDDIALQTLSTAKSSKLSFAITLPLIGTHVIFPSSDGGRFVFFCWMFPLKSLL